MLIKGMVRPRYSKHQILYRQACKLGVRFNKRGLTHDQEMAEVARMKQLGQISPALATYMERSARNFAWLRAANIPVLDLSDLSLTKDAGAVQQRMTLLLAPTTSVPS